MLSCGFGGKPFGSRAVEGGTMTIRPRGGGGSKFLATALHSAAPSTYVIDGVLVAGLSTVSSPII